MSLKIQLVGGPAPMCSGQSGQVILLVRFSDWDGSGITEADFGPVCQGFAINYKLLRDHEPHVIYAIPRAMEGVDANRAVQIFEKHCLKRLWPSHRFGCEMNYY